MLPLPAPIRSAYELKFERPNSHLLDVTMHVDALSGATVDFAIPDWAPGSYYIENYAANVQRFRAHSASGQELTWRKTDSQTWRIDLAGAKSVTVEYQVYANTLQNNIAQYNERHAFIGGPSVWMYVVGAKDRPATLSIAVPSGWRVATGMDHTSATTFQAPNYDTFADCPLEISDFAEKDFEVLGTKYHVIVHDVMGQKDFAKFMDDLQKIVAQDVAVFQPVAGTSGQAAPFKDYYFIFHVWPKTGGGLEHLNSTQIDFAADWDSMEPDPGFVNAYDLKLFVSAHEFFHAWNVKRLRPLPLGPFDYSQMVHTPSLWISEGLTSYYGALALVRAGLITPEQYLDAISQLITKFEAQSRPQRAQHRRHQLGYLVPPRQRDSPGQQPLEHMVFLLRRRPNHGSHYGLCDPPRYQQSEIPRRLDAPALFPLRAPQARFPARRCHQSRIGGFRQERERRQRLLPTVYLRERSDSLRRVFRLRGNYG